MGPPLGVTIENLTEAETNEDDFDACVTAAALLRCVLEHLPLYASPLDTRAEGGILGTGSVNLDLSEQTFGSLPAPDIPIKQPRQQRRSVPRGATDVRPLRCPIPGCTKVYVSGRGGWDGHVGSLRIHPDWYPDLHTAEERKDQFKAEYPDFFE